MDDNRKYSCLRLETLGDVKAIITEVLDEIRIQNKKVEMSGRICNLLQVWLKAHEIAKATDFEERIAWLEDKANKNKKIQVEELE